MNDALTSLRFDGDLPPSKVDIDRAVRTGRRRERRRRALLASAGIAGCALLVSGMLVAQDRRPPADTAVKNGCQVQRLPTPGNAPGTVTATSGRYAVGVLDNPTGDPLLLWDDGRLRPVTGTPRPDPTPVAVDDSGTVVGNSGDKDPWLLRDGGFTHLATPAGATRTIATAINAKGSVIGTATWLDADGRATQARTVRWSVADPGRFQYVATDPALAYVSGINGDDVIVGRASAGGTDYHAFAWTPDGTAVRLNRIDGKPAESAFQVAGDWAIGSYDDGSTWFSHGVRWNLRTGEHIEFDTFVPSAVDASGTMVGTVMNSADDTAPARWKDGAVLMLPVLSAGQSATMTSMSSDGRVAVGWLFRDKNDPVVPVRWLCS
ncbi:hypothetical protein [Dactylosporangium matsuzakiense]|uniref:Uncharacterized protein n=1 Tax=Dactylosporangium matsuzakiense TaxID=53360 RepID=A0A9W6NSZ1_9ACTN|nr:hypothetical protein [Dactylosporangium matsuzakiense]UWZ45442.1 hypothetical protein Dmats_02525 [Dactylosporangium matsuzakiense]GLL08144.1 hypothetical protein GCM10017581_099040 [Dactylosporangium matsuzakiense]